MDFLNFRKHGRCSWCSAGAAAVLWAMFAACGTPAAQAQCQGGTVMQELLAGDRASGSTFGNSVGVSGDTAIVGARNTPLHGRVYIYVRSGAIWTQQAELVPPTNTTTSGSFGYTVAINGNTALISSPIESGDGRAYIYTRSGTAWTLQATLAPDVEAGQNFGISLALGFVGTHLEAIVGAPQATVSGHAQAGAAYVYTFDTLHTGSTWQLANKLIASDNAAGDAFGACVSISGSTAAVGSPATSTSNGPHTGAAYVFTSNFSGAGWTQQAKLWPTGGVFDFSGFGNCIGVNLDTLVGGTGQGVFGFFTRSGTVWSQHQTLNTSVGLGSTIRIVGDTMLAGSLFPQISAPQVLARPAGAGIAGTWAWQATLRAPDAVSGDEFGIAADMSGSTIIVGSPYHAHSPPLPGAGSAYIFDTTTLNPPLYTQQPVDALACPGGSAVFVANVSSGGPATVSWQVLTAAGTWVGLENGPQAIACAGGGTGQVGFVNHASNNAQIFIQGCAGVQHAQFRCLASNDCGATFSNQFTLTMCPADFNCDGSVDLFDYLDFVNAFGGQSSSADFNHDGSIDFFDYLDFVQAFSVGC